MSSEGDAVPLTLRAENVSKTFPGTRALIEVDFDIRPGEVHALVGQNGSGKSTFIKLLAGFHEPDAGSVAHFGGQPFQLGSAAAAHDAGIRFVHQDLGLVGTLDTVDNLAIGVGYTTGSGFRIKWRRQKHQARKAVEQLGYHIDLRMPIDRLAPVERTAIAIARALQGFDTGASLLVLDEPTATMPRAEVERLFHVIRRVKARGIAVLYVSHHLDEVFDIADRVTVFRDGRKVATRQIADTVKRDLVELMTGGWEDVASADSHRPAEDVVLKVRGVSTKMLHDINLDVHRGEVVGVAGITGSGREELCEALFGGRPRSGTVEVNGATVEAMRPDMSVEHGIGLIPSDRHGAGCVLSMSVRENLTIVDLAAFWKRFRLRHRDERGDARTWIQRLRVRTPDSETLVESLSGGNQQKVVVGKWLRINPKVLLLDEPTQGVDVAAKAEIHGLIERVAAEGAAVLVCSSDEPELERICDRAVVLRSGVIVAEFHRPGITAPRLVQEGLQQSAVPVASGRIEP